MHYKLIIKRLKNNPYKLKLGHEDIVQKGRLKHKRNSLMNDNKEKGI